MSTWTFASAVDVVESMTLPAIRPPRVRMKLMSDTPAGVTTIGVANLASQDTEQGMLL